MKLTVVTVCRNDLARLRATLASLDGQSARDFEHWVIDGGSTDGTVEFLQGRGDSAKFHFLSENDAGIYDAMNKGVARAAGEFSWFLNAGDTCADTDAVANILRGLAEDPTVDVLYGRVWVESVYGRRSVGTPVTARDFRVNMPVCHQGIVYRTSRLRELPYPAGYRIIADWIVTRTLAERGARFRFLDRHLAVYDLAGVSSRAHASALREMLRHEETAPGKLRVLVGFGGRLLGLWVARKTGLRHLYKKRQHART